MKIINYAMPEVSLMFIMWKMVIIEENVGALNVHIDGMVGK